MRISTISVSLINIICYVVALEIEGEPTSVFDIGPTRGAPSPTPLQSPPNAVGFIITRTPLLVMFSETGPVQRSMPSTT